MHHYGAWERARILVNRGLVEVCHPYRTVCGCVQSALGSIPRVDVPVAIETDLALGIYGAPCDVCVGCVEDHLIFCGLIRADLLRLNADFRILAVSVVIHHTCETCLVEVSWWLRFRGKGIRVSLT